MRHTTSAAEASGGRRRTAGHRPKRRGRSEFVTTLTLEKAMAAPATIGDRKPSAAMGIASVL